MKKIFPCLALILLVFFLGIRLSFSQSTLDSLNFYHVEAEMSQSSVTEILEDSRGFLWVGTTKGINRYDGTDFKVFEETIDGITGLTNSYIESIYEDITGTLFIGTNRGLNVYDQKLAVVKPYNFKTQGEKIQNEHITVIKRISDFLWLGTSENGLYRYNVSTGETLHLKFDTVPNGPNNNRIVELFLLPNDFFLVTTEGSSYILDHELFIQQEVKKIQFTSSALKVSSTDYFLGSRNGDLLVYTIENNKLSTKDTIVISPQQAILDMEKDNAGNVWLGTENGGLSIYKMSSGTVSNFRSDYKRPHSIQNNSIWSLYKARNGVMWVGAYKKGLSFYDSNYFKFKKIASNPFDSNSLSNNIVNCFAEDNQNNIWIGTDGGGLNYWNRKNRSFEHYSKDLGNLNINVILSIERDNNKLWLGSWANGITIFDMVSKKYEVWNSSNSFLNSDNVMDILKDSKGRIWIAELRGGLQIYYPDSGKHENIELKSEIYSKNISLVSHLMEDNTGAIWVGTEAMGIYRLMEKNGKWSHDQYHNLSTNKFLSNNFVNTIAQDDYENLWVGTQAGLNKFIPSENSFEAITKKDGLKSDAIRGIVQDEYGFLWLSTDRGVTRYDEEKTEFLDYDSYDGLQGSEFNASSFYRTSNFEIIFGGSNGFNIFNSKQAAKRTDVLKVLISDFKIFNTPVRPNDDFGILNKDISQVDSISLSYKHSVFNVEFKALTLKAAEKISYAYFLEGFENEWNYIGNNTSATYTNLNPGEYRLHIKSTNSDGVWNNDETLLNITITPPFWKTWWFRILLTSFILSMIYLIYFLRMRSIKIHQTNLERKIDERTKELRLQQKKLLKAADELSIKNEEIQRFTYSVSHDLKSPLNGIKGIAGLIPFEIPLNDFPEMEKYLEMINTSCDTMGNLIADITEMAKIGKVENKNEFLDTKEVIDFAKSLVNAQLKAKDIDLKISENLPEIYGDKNRMIQVFGNLMDNAIKYMGNQKKPVIKIETIKIGEEVQFQVIDNGSGMDKKSLEKLFSPFERFHPDTNGTGLGLYMIKQIIESHGGQIKADSPGKEMGTVFFITLPNARLRGENHYKKKSTTHVIAS